MRAWLVAAAIVGLALIGRAIDEHLRDRHGQPDGLDEHPERHPLENCGAARVPLVAWIAARADTFVLDPGYFTLQEYDSSRVLFGEAAARAYAIEAEREAAWRALAAGLMVGDAAEGTR